MYELPFNLILHHGSGLISECWKAGLWVVKVASNSEGLAALLAF